MGEQAVVDIALPAKRCGPFEVDGAPEGYGRDDEVAAAGAIALVLVGSVTDPG
jgi:hypothetical protein